MKLLLDENLPPKLARSLQDLFPGSVHVEECGLAARSDDEIWHYAAEHRFVIMSKDSDFYDMSALYGGPPKVVWLRVGNCSARSIEALLVRSAASITALDASSDTTLLIYPRRTRE